MTLIAAGLMNRQVATEMGVTEVTVKAHKAKIMKKLDANSLADLVRMADTLGLPHIRRNPETGEVSPLVNQILLRQVDAVTAHKLDARDGLTVRNGPATCATLPTSAASSTPCQDSSSAGDKPFGSLDT